MRNEVLYMPKQHFVWNVCTAGEPPADQGEQAAGIEAGRQLRAAGALSDSFRFSASVMISSST